MSQDTAIEYRGWTIEPHTYESDSGRWGARVILSFDRKTDLYTTNFTAGQTFDTEKQAREYIIGYARWWVDNRAEFPDA
jgi:hypothetical protein